MISSNLLCYSKIRLQLVYAIISLQFLQTAADSYPGFFFNVWGRGGLYYYNEVFLLSTSSLLLFDAVSTSTHFSNISSLSLYPAAGFVIQVLCMWKIYKVSVSYRTDKVQKVVVNSIFKCTVENVKNNLRKVKMVLIIILLVSFLPQPVLSDSNV
jgi:hypothetical protein